MRKFFFSAGFFILTYSGLLAQKESVMDSVMLDEITAIAAAKKYQAGSKIESISTDQFRISQEGGIDQLLMRFTPIYLKSNAGGLSSIHFRGTSANHTTVNFGGINVNSLTLGSADMTAIPSYLFDGIDLQYGSSSAVNGSGAIGGSISLGMQTNWTDGLKINGTISQGSFGEQFYGAKVFAGNGKWESVSRLYYFNKKNDFPFKNPYTGDVENRDPVDDRQHGSSIENMGLIQEVNYRFSKEEQVKSAIWLEDDWHQIQPNMQTNLNFIRPEVLDNKNIRYWSDYQNNKHEIKYRGGLGYVHDMQVYDSDQVQKIGTDRLILEMEFNQDISKKIGYKAGAKYQYIVPNVYAYSDSIIDSEQHIEAYFSSFLKLKNRLKLTLNLRQMYVTNFSVPFTPSVGAEYHLFSSEKTALNVTSNVARSYRVPTFNDRYWGTQGNPNLKPEDGMNYELGINYLFVKDNLKTNIKLNAFYMDVKNWIEWRNFGVWQAQNVKEVVSKGIEFQTSTDFNLGKTSFNFRLNYNYNPVDAIKDFSETGVVGRQLIYTPRHMANTYLMAKYRNWQIYADGSYTGTRFSDDFGNQLDSYFLANCGFSRKVDYKQQHFNLSFSVNNLLSADYQNEKYYAMPGRSFRISLSTNLSIK